MSAPLDTKKMWAALMALSDSAAMPPTVAVVYKGLVDGLGPVLAPFLDRRATLAVLIEAKLAVVEHILATGFTKKLIAAIPAEILPCPVAEMVAGTEDQLKMLRMPFMELIHNTASFLKQLGASEEEFLKGRDIGLSSENLLAWKSGRLTIRLLAESQPHLFVAYQFEIMRD